MMVAATCFTAQSLLISAVSDKPFVCTVQQYAQLAEDNFKKQQVEVWGEQEACSQTHVCGKIAKRFSTCKIVPIADGKETLRSYSSLPQSFMT